MKRSIPENHLAVSVFIKLENNGAGSGFMLRTENEIYLITAKHVIFNDSDILKDKKISITCQTPNVDDDSSHIIVVDFKKLTDLNIFKHKSADVAGLRIGTYTHNEVTGKKSMALIKGATVFKRGNGNFVGAPKKMVFFLKDVLISNDVFVFGYPVSLGLKESPLFDYSKPLLRKGIVANINKSSGTIILDCPVDYGNSGGPVVQVHLEEGKRRYKVIGVVSKFIPFEESWVNTRTRVEHKEHSNSGYSVAVAMDSVFDMLGLDKNDSSA